MVPRIIHCLDYDMRGTGAATFSLRYPSIISSFAVKVTMVCLQINRLIDYIKRESASTHGAIRQKCATEPVRCAISVLHNNEDDRLIPLYHPKIPSAFKVFHKQSIGPLYSRPTDFPLGNFSVGWLYTLVSAWR